MEYLQFLIILQQIAVGGSALAGFAYFFFGTDSAVDFLKREIKEWTLRTTLLWLTGSFALGYAVEDIAKQLVDGTRGRLVFGKTSIDERLHFLLQTLFEPDNKERFYALFTWKAPNEPVRRDNENFIASPLLRELWGVYKSRCFLSQTQARSTNALLGPELDHDEDNAFHELFYKPLSSTTLGSLLDDPAPEKAIVTSKTDLKTLLDSVTGVYYQAHNLVVTRPTYSDELARIEQRRTFFRGLGFLSEVFLILYGTWAAVYPVPRHWLWDSGLALVTGLFAYTLSLPEMEKFGWDWVQALFALLCVAAIVGIRFGLPRLPSWCKSNFRDSLGKALKHIPHLQHALLPRRNNLQVDDLKPIEPSADTAFALYRIGTHLKDCKDDIGSLENYLESTKGHITGLDDLRDFLRKGKAFQSRLSERTIDFEKLLRVFFDVKDGEEFSKSQRDRSTSLARFALLAAFVLGLCTIGSHSESMEYNLRVFGYYIVELTHGQAKTTQD
jgi:hypothetical protein